MDVLFFLVTLWAALFYTDDPRILQLGHADFSIREQASAGLKRDLSPVLEYQLVKYLLHPDLEIVCRVRPLLSGYRERIAREQVAEVKRRCRGVLPWISEMPPAEGQDYVEYTYWLGIAPIMEDRAPDWKRHRAATEVYLLEQARAGKDIFGIVEKMKASQRRWTAAHGGNYTPPVVVPWQ